MQADKELVVLGWREWVSLPALGLERIKAKIDTGARTSALHAFELRFYNARQEERVEFKLHPHQRDSETVIVCDAAVIDKRVVTDSGGHSELRPVIKTDLCLGPHRWSIKMTLTTRDNMLFRMLLGRTAMKGRATVDPARSYLVGKKPKRKRTAT